MTRDYSYTPIQIQEIREKVRKIANYRCYFCNKDVRKVNGNGLSATTHHIIPKSLMKEDCWDINNLKCICRICHNKIEKFNRKIFQYLRRHYRLDTSKYYKKLNENIKSKEKSK